MRDRKEGSDLTTVVSEKLSLVFVVLDTGYEN